MRSRSKDANLSLKGSGRSKGCTKYSPTLATASMRLRLVTAVAAKGGELRHFDAEEALLETSVGEEINV